MEPDIEAGLKAFSDAERQLVSGDERQLRSSPVSAEERWKWSVELLQREGEELKLAHLSTKDFDGTATSALVASVFSHCGTCPRSFCVPHFSGVLGVKTEKAAKNGEKTAKTGRKWLAKCLDGCSSVLAQVAASRSTTRAAITE